MLPPFIRSAIALAVSLLPAAIVLADDWPQFGGPNRDGAWNESGLLKAFPADGLKIRWRVPVGSGWSSPIVSGGRVFVCDAERKKPKAWERIHCYDEKTGKPL